MNALLTLAEIEDSVTMLPAFPRIVLDLLDTVDDEWAGQKVLAAFLRRDPIVAGRLRPKTTSAPPDTGGNGQWLRETVLISSLAGFSGLLGREPDALERGLAVGICAQELGRRCGLNREFALVAGLLYDIGRTWMACCRPRGYSRVADQVKLSGRTACEVERELFGMDHCEVGYCAARAWGLPAPILDAIAQHHRPRRGTPDCLVAAIHLADVCSNGPGLHRGRDGEGNALSAAALSVLGIVGDADIHGLLGGLDARIRHARTHLH